MPESFLLARRTLAGEGTTFTEEDLQDRKDDFLKTLREQFLLERLLGSKVHFEFEMDGDSLAIVAYLVPCHQRRPSLPGFSGGGSDPFLTDIKLIKKVRADLRDLYETAAKSDADPRGDPELADRRRQIWNARRRGSLTIYSTVDGEDLPLESVDKWMPHARMARTIFAVDRIGRHECRVRVRSLIPVQREGDKQSTPVHLPSAQVDIFRDQLALGWTAGQKLSKAMEEKIDLQTNIRLEFSWIDGTLSRLTLLEVPIEVEAQTTNAAAAQSHTAGPEEGAPDEDAPELKDAPIPFYTSDPFPRLHLIWERANSASTTG